MFVLFFDKLLFVRGSTLYLDRRLSIHNFKDACWLVTHFKWNTDKTQGKALLARTPHQHQICVRIFNGGGNAPPWRNGWDDNAGDLTQLQFKSKALMKGDIFL